MSADSTPSHSPSLFLRRSIPVLLAACLLPWAGCGDQATDPDAPMTARLSMATVFPADAAAQASLVDGWRVQVSRPGAGAIAEESGIIEPGQTTVSVQISVTLESPCETLSILVELSAAGEVWFRTQGNHQVCTGSGNELQTQELQFVRPQPTVSPGTLTLTVQERQATSSSFRISYDGADDLVWSAWVQEGNAGWLNVEPSTGSVTSGQPQDVTVDINAAGLSPGTYAAGVVVTGEGFPVAIGLVLVNLTVTPGPQIGITPLEGISIPVLSGLDPDPRTFSITNTGGGTLNWTATDDVGWMSVSPSTGSLGSGQSQGLTITVASANLEAGTYLGTITVRDPNAVNSPQTLSVSLVVSPRAMIGLEPTSLNFSALEGTDPWEQYIQITNTGGSTLNWTATEGASWLSVVPNSGTLWFIPGVGGLSTQLTVNVTSADLPPGDYQTTITFTDPAAGNSPQTVTVDLAVLPRTAPTISKLTYGLRTLNDTTCANDGSRFDMSFEYMDLDGDVPVSDGWTFGEPVALKWQFLPEGLSGGATFNTEMDGDGFSGTAIMNVCIAYEYEGNTSVMETFRLRDEWGLWSNAESIIIPRPDGANSPPPASMSGSNAKPHLVVEGGR